MFIQSDHHLEIVASPTLVGDRRDTVLARLREQDRHVPKSVLASVLDRFRHDREVHLALIRRRSLPSEIVVRLMHLVASRKDLDLLLMRHAKGSVKATDLRMTRPQPRFWKTGLFAGTP